MATLKDKIAKQQRYWQLRAEQDLVKAEKLGLAYEVEVAKQYKAIQEEIANNIASLLGNASDMSELKNKLDTNQLKSYLSQLKKQLKEAEGNTSLQQQIQSKIVTANKATKLQAAKNNIKYQLDKTTSSVEKKMSSLMKTTYVDNYYKTLYNSGQLHGISANFELLNTKALDAILKTSFEGKNYSSRVWANSDALANSLSTILSNSVAKGNSIPNTIVELNGQVANSYSNHQRLVRTELNLTYNKATIQGYKSTGTLSQYKILATKDNRTSDICKHYDGKVFNLEDAKPGINMPPFHPNCRSATVAVFNQKLLEEPEEDKDIIVVPPTKTYEQFVDDIKPKAKAKDIDTIKVNKIDLPIVQAKPEVKPEVEAIVQKPLTIQDLAKQELAKMQAQAEQAKKDMLEAEAKAMQAEAKAMQAEVLKKQKEAEVEAKALEQAKDKPNVEAILNQQQTLSQSQLETKVEAAKQDNQVGQIKAKFENATQDNAKQLLKEVKKRKEDYNSVIIYNEHTSYKLNAQKVECNKSNDVSELKTKYGRVTDRKAKTVKEYAEKIDSAKNFNQQLDYALNFYSYKGDEVINGKLRQSRHYLVGDSLKEMPKDIVDNVVSNTEQILDKGFEVAATQNTFVKPYILYRRMSLEVFASIVDIDYYDLLDDLKAEEDYATILQKYDKDKNLEMYDNAYTSTAFSLKSSFTVSENEAYSKHGVTMVLNVQPNIPALSTNGSTEFPPELEVLLPKGCTITVNNITKVDDNDMGLFKQRFVAFCDVTWQG